jgi:hypothetical protein
MRRLALTVCSILVVTSAGWIESPATYGQNAAPAATPYAWKAGTAKVDITPKTSMWMAGYASRKKPSEGVALPLFAKATAFEDADGGRMVIVTCDLIGIPKALRANVEAQTGSKYGLSPEKLLLNASHTHCGPEFRSSKAETLNLSDERARQGVEYFNDLEAKLVALVGKALEGLAPAKLEYVHARCGFAMNRRTPSPTGYKNNPWSEGPVDHEVPVLKITGADGKLRGVLFGYACHNTTLSFFQFCGDYAGYAQEYLETKHPEITAAFVMGCGGDQNPYPRGELELCRHHGKTLGIAVEAALASSPAREVRGPIRSALRTTEFEFAPPPPKAVLEQRTQSPSAAEAAHAKRLLAQLADKGRIETTYTAPTQAVRFGDDLLLVAFPGETVIDYALRIKRENGAPTENGAPAKNGVASTTGEASKNEHGPAVWVAGYSNDVFGYIPSKRVLLEGGYEAGGAFLYSRFPGPLAPDVEDRMMRTANDAIRAVSK